MLRFVIAGGREEELLLLLFGFEFEFVVLGPELVTGLDTDRWAAGLENLAVALLLPLLLLLLLPVELRMLFVRCLLRRRLS
jgi:cell shape-determining protein MreD